MMRKHNVKSRVNEAIKYLVRYKCIGGYVVSNLMETKNAWLESRVLSASGWQLDEVKVNICLGIRLTKWSGHVINYTIKCYRSSATTVP